MFEKMSIKDFVELPDVMLDNSKNVKYIQLLSESTISYYYYPNLKKDLINIFDKFKDSKYLIDFDEDYFLQSNSKDLEMVRSTNSINDKVGNFIEKKIDLNIWSRDIYKVLFDLSNKLTIQETIYLISAFFDEKTEDAISESLDICKRSLYKIKKSCLVKIKLELDKNNLMN